ncbi:MAG: hypothetical protein J7L23_01990 [Candidatus Diapherotrites archaeon]|nr:hypothetical protein [Candidatus Diapherotrites archaeon]
MQDKWYYFVAGVLVTAGFLAVVENLNPSEGIFTNLPTSGFVVKRSLMEDLSNAREVNMSLLGYDSPFDGVHNLPEAVVYNGVSYRPVIVSYNELKDRSSELKIHYLLSIGEAPDGKFPVYWVEFDGVSEKMPILDGIVVLNQSFSSGSEPFD